MRVQKDPFLLSTQVIFSSDTTYFNIHINIYMNKKYNYIHTHRDALRITKLASDIYDILRGYYKSKSERVTLNTRREKRTKRTKRTVTEVTNERETRVSENQLR